jgi:hypothetical protein
MKRFAALVLMTGMMAGAYAGAAPTVTATAPSSGTINGGTTVTITGTNFNNALVAGAAGVKFGGTNATSYVVISDTTIQAVTPAHATGAVSIDVTNASGTNVANVLYTYKSANVNLQVSVKVTIAKRADIQWGAGTSLDDAGVDHTTVGNRINPYTWIVKDAEYGAANQVNPNAIYLTSDAQNGTKTINVSNISLTNSDITINAQCTNAINTAAAAPTGTTWVGAGAPAADVFEMRAKMGAGAFAIVSPGPAVLTALLVKGTDQALVLEFSSPTSLTVAAVAGVQQTITVSLVATAN